MCFFSPNTPLQDVLSASYLNCVRILCDSMPPTAGCCCSSSSGSPQAGTSTGQPKTSKGPSCLCWCCNLKPTSWQNQRARHSTDPPLHFSKLLWEFIKRSWKQKGRIPDLINLISFFNFLIFLAYMHFVHTQTFNVDSTYSSIHEGPGYHGAETYWN